MSEQRSRPARTARLRGGNHGLTPAQVAESQRERIEAAMRAQVAEHGYGAVPVAAVLRRAGVSRKTFYELYAGKEECFVAVYEAEMERLLAPALTAFEGSEPWIDRVRTALGVLLGALANDPEAARICFVEVLAAGPHALESRTRALAALDPLFAPNGSTEAGGPAAPARSLTAGSVGYLAEVLHREVAAGRAPELPSLRPQLIQTLALPFAGAHARAGETTPGGAENPPVTAADADERAFLAAYGERAADLLGRVSAAIATDDEPAARVRAGVGALLGYCAEHPDRARAVLVEALSVGPAARERRTETVRRVSELLEQPLRELRPNDRIARVSAVALVGGLLELAYDPIDRLAPGDLPSVETVVEAARLG